MQTLERWIGRISLMLVSLILLAMMLQIVIDVFMRTVLGAGFPATADMVGRYYMVGISLLPLAATEIARRHIEATVFTDKLTGLPRLIISGLGFVMGIVVFSLLAWGSYGEAMKQTSRGAYVEAGLIHLPTWGSYWILPVSFSLMVIVLALRFYELITGQFEAHPHDPLTEVQSAVGGTE